jgi:hypothetical protein
MGTPDLRVTYDQVGASFQFTLPGPGNCQVCMDHANIRVQSTKCFSVLHVFVDTYQLAKIPGLQTRNQILTDQACGSGDDDFARWHSLFSLKWRHSLSNALVVPALG